MLCLKILNLGKLKQCAPLNEITDNVYQSLNGIKFIPLAKFQTTLSYLTYAQVHFAYYYRFVIVREPDSFSLSQSDPIKRLPLYWLSFHWKRLIDNVGKMIFVSPRIIIFLVIV